MEKISNSQKDWHSAFKGGLNLSLREYQGDITIESEHQLTELPPRIDFLVIKKKDDINIDNAFGRAFRRHNIIEYKNPNDALNIDVIYKVIGYAGLYKGIVRTVNEIPAEELTITVFRSAKPIKLFKQWERQGKTITETDPGVYRIYGIIEIPLQIVVTKELDDPELIPLKILMKKAAKEAVRKFLLSKYSTPGEKQDADAVLQVSVTANWDLYEELRGEKKMCKALNQLMSDELNKREEIGEKNGEKIGREKKQDEMIRNMIKKKYPLSDIAEVAGVTIKYIKGLMNPKTA